MAAAMRLTARRTLFGLAMLVGGCTAPPPDHGAVGMLEWDRIEMLAEQSEPIVEIPVHEGDMVAAGTVLLKLNPTRVQARLDEASARRDAALARLAELERGTRTERIVEARSRAEGATRVLAARERELARVAALVGRRLASAEDVDRARAVRDAARADRDAAHALLEEAEHGATAEEIAQARHAAEAAAAAVRRLRIDLERMTIRAPRPARVDSLPLKQGEQPRVGEIVAVLLDGARPYARVYVPELIRVQVRPGSAASVSVDGLPAPLRGRVRTIASESTFTPYFALTERDRGRVTYVAEIDLVSADRALPAGVPVVAHFDAPAAPVR
ncbi:MAG: HlyD family secretion protein [Gammaproteobacteria bacterium]